MQFVEPPGKLTDGFYAFRRMSPRLPMIWWLVPFLYLPGAGFIGQTVYDGVARHRLLFKASRVCGDDQCRWAAPTAGSSSKT